MQEQQLCLFKENENIPRLKKQLAGKLFNEGVYKENYTKEKALNAISNCVGVHLFEVIIQESEKEIVSMLRSEKEQTF